MGKEKSDNNSINNAAVEQLMEALSVAFGRRLSTSADYNYLAEAISSRVGEYVSPTTLKRVGGYLRESVTPRRTTLDILARALGYPGFDEFCRREEIAGQRSSDPSAGHWLDVAQLRRGMMVDLTWLPDRRCCVRFLGGDLWEVAESVATRLKAGQRFHCSHIINGEPLQILLEPSEITPRQVAYVCGRQQGVRFKILS